MHTLLGWLARSGAEDTSQAPSRVRSHLNICNGMLAPGSFTDTLNVSQRGSSLCISAGELLGKDPYASPKRFLAFPSMFITVHSYRGVWRRKTCPPPCLPRHTALEGLQTTLFLHGWAFYRRLSSHQKRTWHVAMKCNYKMQLKGRLGKILTEEFCEV